jgi:hypothetical protein
VYSKCTQNTAKTGFWHKGKRRESAFIEVRNPALQMTDLLRFKTIRQVNGKMPECGKTPIGGLFITEFGYPVYFR